MRTTSSATITLPPRFSRRPRIDPTDAVGSLYQFRQVAPVIAAMDRVRGPEVDAYRELGFLAVDGVLDQPRVRHALDGLVDVVAEPSGALVEHESWAPVGPVRLGGRPSLDGVRKLAHFVDVHAGLRAIAHDPSLIRLVRDLLGADPELYQDMALLKPPGGGR